MATRVKTHGWVGEIPLGVGSQAVTLCGEVIEDVATVPLWDIQPVGGRIEWPEGICKACQGAAVPGSKNRQFVYAIRSRSDERKVTEKLDLSHTPF